MNRAVAFQKQIRLAFPDILDSTIVGLLSNRRKFAHPDTSQGSSQKGMRYKINRVADRATSSVDLLKYP